MTDNNPTQSNQTVDGFADSQGEGGVDSPDYGGQRKIKPMSDTEYAEAKKEIEEQGDRNRLTEHKEQN